MYQACKAGGVLLSVMCSWTTDYSSQQQAVYLTKPAELSTGALLHVALLEVPHAKADADRLHRLPFFPLPIDGLSRSPMSPSPVAATRMLPVPMTTSARVLRSASTTPTAPPTTFSFPPLSTTLPLQRSIALHR